MNIKYDPEQKIIYLDAVVNFSDFTEVVKTLFPYDWQEWRVMPHVDLKEIFEETPDQAIIDYMINNNYGDA